MLTWIWTELMRSFENNRGIFLVLVLILIAFVLSSCGITASRSNEGYANLDSPGMGDTNRTMSLSLGKTTLRFAARFLDDEPETQALLRSLDGVRIRIYEVHGDTDRIAHNFERMGNKLGNELILMESGVSLPKCPYQTLKFARQNKRISLFG